MAMWSFRLEAQNLRSYLRPGFLHISDNYGMDPYVRRENGEGPSRCRLVGSAVVASCFSRRYDLNQGLPKVHEHDDLPPQGLGLFHKGRLVVFTITNPIWATMKITKCTATLRKLAVGLADGGQPRDPRLSWRGRPH